MGSAPCLFLEVGWGGKFGLVSGILDPISIYGPYLGTWILLEECPEVRNGCGVG